MVDLVSLCRRGKRRSGVKERWGRRKYRMGREEGTRMEGGGKGTEECNCMLESEDA